MSFIKARGEEAAAVAAKEKVSVEKLLKTFKSGDSYRVRIAGVTDFVSYESHSVFGKNGTGILTTPCVHGKECPYCQATTALYAEFNRTQDEEVKGVAGQLKKKERFLFGFINLEDGQPLVLDFSKKQAKGLIDIIKKNATKINKNAFEISKNGSGQATIVALDRLDEEDLSAAELKAFTDAAKTKILDEQFEVLQVKTIEEALTDLRNFGFATERIGTNAVAGGLPTSGIDTDSDDLFGGTY